MATILITGIGLISKELEKTLISEGYNIRFLSQNEKKINNINIFKWNVKNKSIDEKAFNDVDYIIHLAGYGISKNRWTKKIKKKIADSRIDSTLLLFNHIKNNGIKIKRFIAASAVGYYGTTNTDQTFTEKDLPGNDFLAEVCVSWEKTIHKFNELNIKTTILRTGVVFSKNGGALQEIIKPIRINLGAVLGSGNQIVPWIHIHDLCKLYLEAITNQEMTGVFNAVAPTQSTNKTVTLAAANILNKKIILPKVPELVLKVLLGEMSSIVLYGSKISSKKVEQLNFKYTYPTLENTLSNLLS